MRCISDCLVIACQKRPAVLPHGSGGRSVGEQTGFEHGSARSILRQLRQIADTQTAACRDSAAVGRLLSGYDTQHGRFAGAVFGHNAYLVALVDAERHIGEEHTVAITLGQTLYLQKRINCHMTKLHIFCRVMKFLTAACVK